LPFKFSVTVRHTFSTSINVTEGCRKILLRYTVPQCIEWKHYGTILLTLVTNK